MNNKQLMEKNIHSLLLLEMPYYFINKIEESNVSIGFQQIEQIDQILNIIKNKNKEDKLENLKKNNIQKCIQWCEKFKIPHNKFVEKNNIFLALPLQSYSVENDEYPEIMLEDEDVVGLMNSIPSVMSFESIMDEDLDLSMKDGEGMEVYSL